MMKYAAASILTVGSFARRPMCGEKNTERIEAHVQVFMAKNGRHERHAASRLRFGA